MPCSCVERGEGFERSKPSRPIIDDRQRRCPRDAARPIRERRDGVKVRLHGQWAWPRRADLSRAAAVEAMLRLHAARRTGEI